MYFLYLQYIYCVYSYLHANTRIHIHKSNLFLNGEKSKNVTQLGARIMHDACFKATTVRISYNLNDNAYASFM